MCQLPALNTVKRNPQPEGESCCCPLIERVSSHLQMPEHAVTSVAWWGGGVGVLSEAEQLSFAKGPEGLFSPHPARAVMFDRVWKVTHLSLFPASLSLEPSPRDGKCYICRYHFSHLSKSVVSEPRKDDPKRSRDGEMINVPGTKSWQHLILFRCRILTE